MPSGLFKTELEGESLWGRLKCLFMDRRAIIDAKGQPVGSFKLNTFTDRDQMWDLVVGSQKLTFPNKHVSQGDYPFSLEITAEERTIATIHSGSYGYKDYSLEWDGVPYDWADVSKVRKVMELRRDEETFARVYSEGMLVNHTFVDVIKELPLEIICLLFCMFGGIVRHRTA